MTPALPECRLHRRSHAAPINSITLSDRGERENARRAAESICTLATTSAWLVWTARKQSLCGLGFGADQLGDRWVVAELVQAPAAVRPDAAGRDA